MSSSGDPVSVTVVRSRSCSPRSSSGASLSFDYAMKTEFFFHRASRWPSGLRGTGRRSWSHHSSSWSRPHRVSTAMTSAGRRSSARHDLIAIACLGSGEVRDGSLDMMRFAATSWMSSLSFNSIDHFDLSDVHIVRRTWPCRSAALFADIR